MKMNSELRTKKMIFRYRAKWVAFYAVVFIFLGLFTAIAYAQLDTDNYGEGHIELTLNKEKYQQGETIEFTIKNHFANTIYIPNNCPEEPLNAYRWYTDRWIQIHGIAENKDSECYAQPRRIAIQPEEQITYHFEEWPDLFENPGVYRIVVPVEHYDDLPFKDFVILEPAEVIQSPSPVAGTEQQAHEPTSTNNPNSVQTTPQAEPVSPTRYENDPIYEDDGRLRNEDGGED